MLEALRPLSPSSGQTPPLHARQPDASINAGTYSNSFDLKLKHCIMQGLWQLQNMHRVLIHEEKN